ncbi:hypothetical protein VCV18_005417 [Metarhizium anisopliae]
MSAKPTTKKFGKSTREVPAPSAKAQKWYPADDENEAKQTNFMVASARAKHKLWNDGQARDGDNGNPSI